MWSNCKRSCVSRAPYWRRSPIHSTDGHANTVSIPVRPLYHQQKERPSWGGVRLVLKERPSAESVPPPMTPATPVGVGGSGSDVGDQRFGRHLLGPARGGRRRPLWPFIDIQLRKVSDLPDLNGLWLSADWQHSPAEPRGLLSICAQWRYRRSRRRRQRPTQRPARVARCRTRRRRG